MFDKENFINAFWMLVVLVIFYLAVQLWIQPALDKRAETKPETKEE